MASENMPSPSVVESSDGDRAFNVFTWGWSDTGRLGLSFERDMVEAEQERIARAEEEKKRRRAELEELGLDAEDSDSDEAPDGNKGQTPRGDDGEPLDVAAQVWIQPPLWVASSVQ